MKNTRVQAFTGVDVRYFVKFLALSGLATVLPFYIHAQWFTGPIINAILVLSLFLVGIRGALVICMVPSLMALSGGLLPAVLAPVVPFIMISNVIFVLSVDFFINLGKNKDIAYLSGVITGALLKFLFLFSSVGVISKLLLKQELAVKVAQMMSWPQFATAVLGGMIAWYILKNLKKL